MKKNTSHEIENDDSGNPENTKNARNQQTNSESNLAKSNNIPEIQENSEAITSSTDSVFQKQISDKSVSVSETAMRAHSATGPAIGPGELIPRKQSLPQISTPITRPRRQTSAMPILGQTKHSTSNYNHNKHSSFTQLLYRSL